MTYAYDLINHLPAAVIGGKTPIEMWSGTHATDYDSLHTFGCPTYYHVQQDKLDHRANKSKFLGFSLGVEGYRL